MDWVNGQWDKFAQWRFELQWRMKRRIMNNQMWRMSPGETTRLYEWIDEFARSPEDARPDDHGVLSTAQPVVGGDPSEHDRT